MYCIHCGSRNFNNAIYCFRCGKRILERSSTDDANETNQEPLETQDQSAASPSSDEPASTSAYSRQATIVLAIVFFLLTPLWSLLMIVDSRRSGALKILAAVIGLAWFAFICPAITRNSSSNTYSLAPTSGPLPDSVKTAAAQYDTRSTVTPQPADASTEKLLAVAANTVAPLPTDTPVPPIPTPAARLVYTELGTYVKAGKTWKNILLSSRSDKQSLFTLAKDIHKSDPKNYYRIFDDGSQFQQYKNWDVNYGKVFDRDGKGKYIEECIDVAYCRESVRLGRVPFPFPEQWTSEHHLANIQEMPDLESNRVRWQLILKDANGESINLD